MSLEVPGRTWATWMCDAEGELMPPGLDVHTDARLTDDQWRAWWAAWDQETSARSHGAGGVKLIRLAGDPTQPRWVAVVDALINLGRIAVADRAQALRAEWIKYPGCPGCESSGAFLRRDKSGRYDAGQVRVSCGRRCQTRDVLTILGVETVPELNAVDLDPGEIGEAGEPRKLAEPLREEPKTELGYANRLVKEYGDRLRYVPSWRRWLVWDGVRWSRDDDGQAQRWMKSIARSLTSEALKIEPKEERKAELALTRRGESAAGVAGALTLASTHREIAVRHEDLDADPFLLNCTNGTLDLRTGQLRPHNPDDLLTKVTGAAYQPDASGTVFNKFLADIQPEEAMRDFIGRLLGHALEGRVIEHVLPIWFGAGANGKSTLLDVVLAALGDYAASADPELLTARDFAAHPTGVADLFGLRLAILHESDEGRRLAEGTVKRLTGGDEIKARRMREDFWRFRPSHSFTLLTNHRPLVGGTDEGIWRRLKLIPFDVTIPLADRDEHLGEKLALEVEAVLSWLVAGHQAWSDRGLAVPPAVERATAAYRADSDLLGQFLEESCFTGPDALTVQSSVLFGRWRAWAEVENVRELSTQKAFTTAMLNRGSELKKTSSSNVWVGLALKSDHPMEGGR